MDRYDGVKKKVVLINPPLSPRRQAGSFKGVANIMMPLGIGYLAAVLEQEGIAVKVIDARALDLDAGALINLLKSEKADIIGLTATVLEIGEVIDFSTILKTAFPDCVLVIGGPQFSAEPHPVMEKSSFDFGVYREGEYIFLELVKYLNGSGEKDISSVKGIFYRERDGSVKFTGDRPYIEDLDNLPFPAIHLYPPLSSYKPIPASFVKLPLGCIITSRGCPYNCIFCDPGAMGRRFRARSGSNVVKEMEKLIKVHGAKEIRFFDDTFTFDRQRIMDICAEILDRNIKIPWSCMTRANKVDPELLRKMREAGCWQIAYGLESGDEKMLKKMKKGVTVSQNENAVKWSKKAGINVRAYFVLGMPGETLESIKRTVGFARSLPIDVAGFYITTLYPGNELFKIAREEGALLHFDYGQYNPIVDVKHLKLAYVPRGMKEGELKKAIVWAHKSFYLRPGYILRQLRFLRNISDIGRYWRGFKTIMRI
jgi:radical SAM superfamily enzyme YgiQ (UPF0313 family)